MKSLSRGTSRVDLRWHVPQVGCHQILNFDLFLMVKRLKLIQPTRKISKRQLIYLECFSFRHYCSLSILRIALFSYVNINLQKLNFELLELSDKLG